MEKIKQKTFNLKKLADDLAMIGYTKPHMIQGTITYIKNPHIFNFQVAKYKELLPYLENPGKVITSSELSIGLFVIFESRRIKKKVRGQIILMTEDDCTMFAVDYGYIEDRVSKEKNYKVNIEFPPIALPCMMANCQPFGESFVREIAQEMKHFVKTVVYVTIYAKVKNKYLVKVQSTSMIDDISTTLCYLNLTTFTCLNNAVSRHKIPKPVEKYTSPYKTLKLGEQVLVRSLASNENIKDPSLELFFVASINEFYEYVNERKSYSNTNAFLEESKIKTGMLVTTEVNKICERAIVSTLSNRHNIGIDLLDLGGSRQVSVNETLKMMPISLMKHEGRAICCSAVDAEKLDRLSAKILQPGYTFFITVLETGVSFYKPYKVKIELIDDNLLYSS